MKMQENQNYELDPNFAVVLSFLERFGKCFGEEYGNIKIKDLKDFLVASEVDGNEPFIRFHLKLCRGIGEKCSTQTWQKAIIKFCKDFPDGDNLLIKERGYTNIPVSAKLRILKNLCEDQFEYNDHFNRLVNKQLDEGTNLRHEQIGKDKFGKSYWFMLDKSGDLRLFRRWWNSSVEDDSWHIVSSDADELERLIEILERNDDFKEEDLPICKPTDISPETISSTDVLSTAAVRRTKAQILEDEKKHNLRHCDVRVERLSQENLRTCIKKPSVPYIPSGITDIKTSVNSSVTKPSTIEDKNDKDITNNTSDIVEISSSDEDNCESHEIRPNIKKEPVGESNNDQKCVKTCDEAKILLIKKNDEVKVKNELNKVELNCTEVNTFQSLTGKAESKFVSSVNGKGDACCKKDDDADKKQEDEKQEDTIWLTNNTVNKKDSKKQVTESDKDKNIFDNAIKDLLLLDGRGVKSESLTVTQPLLNWTKEEKIETNEKLKCFNKHEEKGEELHGFDNDQIDQIQHKSLTISDDLNLSHTDRNNTLAVFSEEKNSNPVVGENYTAKLGVDENKSSANSCDETPFYINTNVKESGTKEKVTVETKDKENKKVCENVSIDIDTSAKSCNKDTLNLNYEEIIDRDEKMDKKKSVSMKVGDEIIQIEEASTDSNDESEVENGKDVKSSSTCTKQEGCKNSNILKEGSNCENSGKVFNGVLNKAAENTTNKCISDLSVMNPDIKVNVMNKKIVKESVKPVGGSAINTSGQNIVLLPVGGISQIKVQVNGTAQIPMINCPTNFSSIGNFTPLLVPIGTKCSIPSVTPHSLSVNQQQSQALKSMLNRPVRAQSSHTNQLQTANSSNIRMILQNKLSTGPVSLPRVSSPTPTIIYAPSSVCKPQPVCVPAVLTLPKPSSVHSSHIVQEELGNKIPKHKTNHERTIENSIKAHLDSNTGNNIPKGSNNSHYKVNEPSVSVQNVTIVVGKDGIHYDKATGKPYKYPNNQRYVIAGPKGKFYDKETGYEVDVPQSENLKHVPGTVYLASGVSFTKEVEEFLRKKKRKEGMVKKCKKRKIVQIEDSESEEEFMKMLESNQNTSESSEKESEDEDYDYEKISERVRAAKNKKVPVRQQYEPPGIENQNEEESDNEIVPLVLGRNAKRAAAKKLTDFSSAVVISSDEESADDDNSHLCTVCGEGNTSSIVLICDECGAGYHMSCLLPPLFLVPLEDWFCPRCEHERLIKGLKEQLKVTRKYMRSNRNKTADRISQKTFSIDSENIVEVERRSCRQRKEVSYNEAIYDKKFNDAMKESNRVEKKTSRVSSSDSDSDSETSENRAKASSKRQSDRVRKLRSNKSKSGQSRAKRRKLTSLEDQSEESGSDYKETVDSESSENMDELADKSDNEQVNEICFTSSGRQIKNVCYKT